ncbi:hypothetical protein Tco_1504568 [Tanacetum coccineum]
MVYMVSHEAFACRCAEGDVVLRQSYKPESYGKLYYACPKSKDIQHLQVILQDLQRLQAILLTFNTYKLFSKIFKELESAQIAKHWLWKNVYARQQWKCICIPNNIQLISAATISRNSQRNGKTMIWYKYCWLPLLLKHSRSKIQIETGQKLDVGFSTTTKQWKEMFSSSRYWRAGAMYRDVAPVQGQSHHSNPNQSSNIMFMEILVEIIKVRNLSSNHKGKLVLSVSKMQNDMLFNGKSHFSICKDTEETQAVMFQCEPKGEFLFELVDDSTKSFGTCSISVLELDLKLPTPKWLEFDSGILI